MVLGALREHALNVHLIWIFFGSTTQNFSIRVMTHGHILKDVIAIEVFSSRYLILE